MALTFVKLLVPYSIAWAMGSANGFLPHPEGAVSPAEVHAIRSALNSPKAECVYSYLGGPNFISWAREWEPDIYDIPDSCGASGGKDKPNGYRALCVSTVMCRTPSLNFAVEKATCYSRDGKSCPPPSKCVQQSFLRSVQNIRAESVMPLYITTEPAKDGGTTPRSTK